MNALLEPLLTQLRNTSLLEYLAAVTGIISVFFSRKVSIWTYPIGLINTGCYVYISFIYELPGEASVNFYYTIMNIYGWYLWMRKDEQQHELISVSWSSPKMVRMQLAFFAICYVLIFASLWKLQREFFPGAIPWADAFASATAFTGMWLMTRKKVESWYWWIATNIASIPLYLVKNLLVTGIYYVILLILAFAGLKEWKQQAKGFRDERV